VIPFEFPQRVYIVENYPFALPFRENRIVVGLLLLKSYHNDVTDRQMDRQDDTYYNAWQS